MTGRCDAREALIGCRGGETHARSAAWSYETDQDGTSAGARGRQKAKEGGRYERERERERDYVLRRGEGCMKRDRKSEMSTSMNNMDQFFLMEASHDQQTCRASTAHSEVSVGSALQTLDL